MCENHWKVEVAGRPDGAIERLGPGHAWVWTRGNGEKEIFDCGLYPAELQAYIGERLGLGPRSATLHH